MAKPPTSSAHLKQQRARPALTDPALAQRFLDEERTLTLKNVRALCWIAMILVPSAAVLDRLAYPHLAGQFLLLRLLCALCLLPILPLTKNRIGWRYFRVLTLAVPMICAFFISLMIYVSGDPASAYYAGLTLCLVAIGLMFHWTYRESCIAVGITLTLYIGLNIPALLRGVSPEILATYLNNIVFIILNSVVIISGSFYHHRIRVREFLTRAEVETQREELTQRNDTLTSTLRQLRETESQLIQTEKLASLGRMSAGIIHEINNPLNFTNQALFVLKKKGKHLPPEQQESFDRILTDIKEGIGRVSSIVSDLRSFSHPNTAGFSHVDLSDVVVQAQRLMSKELEDGKTELHTELTPNLTIMGDRNQLIQVLINFMQNAIDAMDGLQQRHITIRTYLQDGRAYLSHEDTGCGIPAENLGKVFDPFFTTKDVGSGMGMGLSVCYRIVHSMKGQLEVESQPGQGADFRISFPPEATPVVEAPTLPKSITMAIKLPPASTAA